MLSGLRILREPRGLALKVVEALCRDRGVQPITDPHWDPRLPSDAEIALEVGCAEGTVAKMIEMVARDIIADEFEIAMISRRGRIFLWYRYRLYLARKAARDAAKAAANGRVAS